MVLTFSVKGIFEVKSQQVRLQKEHEGVSFHMKFDIRDLRILKFDVDLDEVGILA